MVDKNNFADFSGQKEVEVESKPQVKLFKKLDNFIGYIQSIKDSPLSIGIDNGFGKDTFGNKVFTFVAIAGADHKSEDGTATGDAVVNKIVTGEEYNFFTNYNKKDFLNINGAKLSVLPMGAIVKLENMGKKKSETSSFSYNNISIIGKKDKNGKYEIHPEYKAVDNFEGQDEINIEDIPF